ncbi:MAG: hypothetical protein NVSMB18_35870 [Acetobacteraceae bacterium]
MRPLSERRWPVRSILIGIVFVLVLPGLAFCGFLLEEFASSQREQVRAQAVATAVRTADALDRELGNLSVALRVLSLSSALGNSDVASFETEARAAVGTLDHDLVLLDPTGQQLLNTGVAPGRQLPKASAMDVLRLALNTHSVVVSNLFAGAESGTPSVSMLMPVYRSGVPVFGLSLYFKPAYFSDLLEAQSLPPGWIASVSDGTDRIFARNHDAERYLGHPTTQDFQDHARQAQAVWIGTAVDGREVLAVSVKLRNAEWRVGVGVPIDLIEEPIQRSVAILALVGAITLALGCGLAWRLALSVSNPLRRLAQTGAALGEGRTIQPVRSRISEVDAVSRALVQATTDLNARNQALASERARLVAIIETVPVGLLIARAPSGTIVAGNGQFGRMLRQPSGSSAATAQPVAFDADGNRVPPELDPLTRALAGADHAELQCRYRRSDGSLFWVLAVGAAIRAENDVVTGAVVALLDIDEVVPAREDKARWAESLEEQVVIRTAELETANQRLRDEMSARSAAEDQLRQAQKMEAVGRLTGGIAHDFNNMLTVVIGSLDLLRRRATDMRGSRLLDNAMEGANRAATLTSRLLAFSRQQPLMPQPIDVNRLVAGMSDLLRRTLGETIQIETMLGEDSWPALADPNQLENALLNLAVNARDAILEASPSGGRLVIETGNAKLDAVYAAQHADVQPGDYVMIATTDTGTGMSDTVLSRAFEPFFTTKPTGQGTGLGLSQVHGFVKQSGGHVGIYTEPGRGTTVKIYLPRQRDLAAGAPSPGAGPAEANGRTGETILVVEDEEGVRRFTTDALRELGYVVLEASGGGQALAVLDSHPETALLFTDVVMAEMGGRELAEAARLQRPDLPVLFTTGYTRNAIIHNGQLDPGVELIGKPFTVAALGAKVRTCWSMPGPRPRRRPKRRRRH